MNKKFKILMVVTLFIVACFLVNANIGYRLIEDNTSAYIDVTNRVMTFNKGTADVITATDGEFKVLSDGDKVGAIQTWGIEHTSYNGGVSVYFVHENSTGDMVFYKYSGPDEELARLSPTLATFPADINVVGIASDGVGKVLCIKDDGNVGTCTVIMNATGECVCS